MNTPATKATTRWATSCAASAFWRPRPRQQGNKRGEGDHEIDANRFIRTGRCGPGVDGERLARGAPCIRCGVRREPPGAPQGEGHEDRVGESSYVDPHRGRQDRW